VLFLKEEGKRTYRLAYAQGLHTPEKSEYALGDTLLDLALKNEQNVYLGDIASHKGKVLPFKCENISSVLCMPLIYEGRILGVVASVSKRKNAFTFHQNYYDMWILDVFITLSRMSLANAFNHEKLARISKTDGLTGLFNHRHLQERLEEELKRVSRSRAPLSLILTDIDHFKKVNDSYGHPAGDAVLKGVSRIIRDRIRETDIAARYGGEEFALILTNTDSVGARKFADELRQAIQKNPFIVDGKSIPVTISLGISSLPPVAQSKEEVIEKADQALYFAKKNGRNRAVLWSEVRN
jgi:diguanylate cyclase (GGDEF)-like protein